MRLGVGCGSGGLSSFVLISEFLGPSKRGRLLIASQMFSSSAPKFETHIENCVCLSWFVFDHRSFLLLARLEKGLFDHRRYDVPVLDDLGHDHGIPTMASHQRTKR